MEWTKCSDRLPDLDTPIFGGWFYNGHFYWDCYVRVYNDDAEGWIWARVEYIGSDEWLCDDEYQITHWMPLPEPSKYFYGKPCPHGHTLRYTKNRRCTVCRRIWANENQGKYVKKVKKKPVQKPPTADFQHRVFVLGNPNIN